MQVYLQEFGTGCLFLATSLAGKPSLVGNTNDLRRAADAMRHQRQLEIGKVWWTVNQQVAVDLAADVTKALGGSTRKRVLDVTAEEAAKMVQVIVAKQNILLYEHDVVMQRTMAAVERIEEALEDGNKNGGLAQFNAAYQEHRKKASIGMPYPEARARLFRVLVRRLARHGAYRVQIKPSVIAAVFSQGQK